MSPHFSTLSPVNCSRPRGGLFSLSSRAESRDLKLLSGSCDSATPVAPCAKAAARGPSTRPAARDSLRMTNQNDQRAKRSSSPAATHFVAGLAEAGPMAAPHAPGPAAPATYGPDCSRFSSDFTSPATVCSSRVASVLTFSCGHSAPTTMAKGRPPARRAGIACRLSSAPADNPRADPPGADPKTAARPPRAAPRPR